MALLVRLFESQRRRSGSLRRCAAWPAHRAGVSRLRDAPSPWRSNANRPVPWQSGPVATHRPKDVAGGSPAPRAAADSDDEGACCCCDCEVGACACCDCDSALKGRKGLGGSPRRLPNTVPVPGVCGREGGPLAASESETEREGCRESGEGEARGPAAVMGDGMIGTGGGAGGVIVSVEDKEGRR
jgi:hypothetical protein